MRNTGCAASSLLTVTLPVGNTAPPRQHTSCRTEGLLSWCQREVPGTPCSLGLGEVLLPSEALSVSKPLLWQGQLLQQLLRNPRTTVCYTGVSCTCKQSQAICHSISRKNCLFLSRKVVHVSHNIAPNPQSAFHHYYKWIPHSEEVYSQSIDPTV